MENPGVNRFAAGGQGQLTPDGRWRWDGTHWVAVAGGGTGFESTYNPLLGMSQPQGLFRRLPRDFAGTALVVQRDDQPLEVIWAAGARAPDAAPPGRGRIRSVYRVDVSDHNLELACEAPSSGDAHLFQARVQLICAVRDPEHVVTHTITDAGASLLPFLRESMRRVSRRHAIEDSAAAEDAVRAELRRREENEGFHPAFALRQMSVSLDLDDTGRQHARELRQQRHRRQVDDELAESTLSRSERYRAAIEEGDWGLVRLDLARNPGNLHRVVQTLRDSSTHRFKNTMEVVRFLVEHEIAGPGDLEALAQLMGTDLSRVLQPPRALPSGRERPSDADADDD